MKSPVAALLLTVTVAAPAACVLSTQVGEEPAVDASVPPPPWRWPSAPIDILFVIDNSGSMAEEQQRLADALTAAHDESSLCNSSNIAALRAFLKEHESVPPEQWPEPYLSWFEACSMTDLLELMNIDFHAGILTTDMHDCDAPYGGAPRASVPQRGCLQTSASDAGTAVVQRSTPQRIERMQDIVRTVGLWGSAWEQGLAALEHFVTPGHSVPSPGTCALARDCSGDLRDFLRTQVDDELGNPKEVPLLVVLLSDEDDCSNDSTIDEQQPGSTDLCYSQPDLLTSTARYSDLLRGLKSSPQLVTLVLISGLVEEGDTALASGCALREGATSTACDPAFGNSVATCDNCVNGTPVCACHPAIDAAQCQGVAHAATQCCEADAAHRYLEVAAALPRHLYATLCQPSYHDVLRRGLWMALQ
ncbi:MAG: hypothetical protein ABIJ09_00325 [Pseudomonadota bacterium]